MTLLSHRWRVPALSGFLILSSWLAGALVWPAAGWFMLAAALMAGAPVAWSAVRALRLRVIGIDLLVAVAAVGAIAIGNYWEAAAVTFLFAVGHALEDATLAKTRSALAELVALAPDTATVIRDGAQVEVPAAEVAVGETVVVKHGGRVPVRIQHHGSRQPTTSARSSSARSHISSVPMRFSGRVDNFTTIFSKPKVLYMS